MIFLMASMTSQCIVVLDAFDSMGKLSYVSETTVHCEVMEAAKKSMSLSFKISIPGLIFEAAEIHPFWACSADNYLKLQISLVIMHKGQD